MKILIISNPRSGSSSLLASLNKSLFSYKVVEEPYNSNFQDVTNLDSKFLNYPDLIVKTITNQVPHILHKVLDINYINKGIVDFYLSYLIPNFDKIILLNRLDETETLKSLYNSTHTGNYHSKYNSPPEIKITLNPNYSSFLTHINNMNQILYRLSDTLNIPITHYEDLYKGDKNSIKNFILINQLPISNFEKFYSYLDPKNRYRQN